MKAINVMTRLGVGSGITVTITPSVSSTSSGLANENYSHTCFVTGGTPSSYTWTALNGGTIASGGSTATASLRGSVSTVYNYRCTVVVGGVSYYADCTRIHEIT